MKKSERYHMAMLAVVNSAAISAEGKIEILATLQDAKGTAEYWELEEAKKVELNNDETKEAYR